MRTLARRARSIWRSLTRGSHLDRSMDEEMRFHLEMEAERLVREQGVDPHEASRLACVAFGGIEKYKEAGRDARGVRWFDSLSLDARLGARMLTKHRGLTLVGGFAMAVAIALGACFFEVLSEMLTRSLPFNGGERIVALEIGTSRPEESRRVLHDLANWRHEVRSIEHAGAFRTIQQNLVGDATTPEPVKVAEMSAAGFTITGVPPLLGRYLLPEDERDAAEPVIVLGYQPWTARFNADPSIVGRTIQLGGVRRTVVGVMPEGYRFPLNHQFWVPLRVTAGQFRPGEGPQVYLFGRLAPRATLEEARAEFTTLASRIPDEGRQDVVRTGNVVPYPLAHVDLTQPALVWLVQLGRLLVGVLTFVVAVNLAILVYARTVARRGELAVRSALGASRRRILAQLFVEAFALTLVGAAGGLLLAWIALARIQWIAHANGGVPFWIRFDLSAITVLYAVLLAAVAAVIMGVIPGLKATGTVLAVNLNDLGGRSGSRLGPVWTSLVVAQIGVAVAVLPAAIYVSWEVVRHELAGVGFAEEDFVIATVAFGDETGWRQRLGPAQAALMARLESEPGVSAVTFSSGVPGFGGDSLAEPNIVGAKVTDVSPLTVGAGFFEAYRAEFLGGRSLAAGDVNTSAVVVSRTFEEVVAEGRSALGLIFRYVPSDGSAPDAGTRWYEVVGVVRDFPAFPPPFSDQRQPYVYHAGSPGQVHPAVISLRFASGIPPDVSDRVRRAALEIDPAMQLRRVISLTAFYDDMRSFWRYIAFGFILVTTAVLMLSAAGIYALMSFTVAQRTREIGIRMALGAHPRRLLFGIFGRAVRQLSSGILAGSCLSMVFFSTMDFSAGRAATLLLSVAVLMLVVGLSAAIGPARRSLRIDATEALRAEG